MFVNTSQDYNYIDNIDKITYRQEFPIVVHFFNYTVREE